MSANEVTRQLAEDQRRTWHSSSLPLPQGGGTGLLFQGHQLIMLPTPVGQVATASVGVSLLRPQQGQVLPHADLSGTHFAPRALGTSAVAMAPSPQPSHYGPSSTPGASALGRGIGQDAAYPSTREGEGDRAGGRTSSGHGEKKRERRSRSRTRDRGDRGSSRERVKGRHRDRSRSRSRDRSSSSSSSGRDKKGDERQHRHKSHSTSRHRSRGRSPERDRDASSRRHASTSRSKTRASPDTSSTRDPHHRHRSRASSSRSHRGESHRDREGDSKMITLRTSQREINVQEYVSPEEAQRLVLEELIDPEILMMRRENIKEEEIKKQEKQEDNVRYMVEDSDDDYDAQKEITGDLSTEEIKDLLVDLMKRRFITFSRGDQQCPVSYQAITNWKFKDDDPKLKGGNFKHYVTLKKELLEHTVKNDASLICHGRNEGFCDLHTLFQHCQNVRGSILHGAVADFLVERRMVDQALVNKRRGSSRMDGPPGRQGGEQRYIWPPVVRIRNLRESTMKQMQKGQQKFAEGIQRVYAYPRDHEVMASFHSSYDGFDKALALVMMVSRKRDVYGPDAEAYIPSLDEFKQLLEEPGRRNKDYARFENLKYEEKSREEIAAMHDAEVKERYREKNEKQVLEYQAMVDKLKKDRENLESTLEETKRTLEKKEAEERDISRKKTEKELLQAKEDSRKLEWLLAKERERNISLHLGYQQELENRIKDAVEQQEMKQQALRDSEMRNLQIKLEQQEAELRRHQQEEVNRAKTQEELEELRRKHEEELTEKKRLLGECENLKREAGAREKSVTKQLERKHREERKRLQEALKLVEQKNEELSNRVLEGASEEEIARLRAELDDTKEDLDRYMNYTVAERNIKTELNEGKKAIVTAILREEEGLMEKYKLDYSLFADMLLEIWINRETLYDLMFKEGGKFSSIKSEAQRDKKVEEVYQALDRIMRLMRGHADPKQNFVPYIEKEGVIGEANYDDYYMKQITKNYGKAVTDYVYKVMVKVDTNNPSGRYPEYKLWDTKADKDMPLEIAVGKLVKKLVSAAPSIAEHLSQATGPMTSARSNGGRSSSSQQQDADGRKKKKRKKGPTTTTPAPIRRVRREADSDTESDSPYVMSEDGED